jgi:hypothetical protein
MISITFKEVFTCNSREYLLNPEWSLEELYRNIGPQISNDYGINQNDLELIDTCNSYVIFKGLPVETYPALPKTNTLLKELWGSEMKYLAMYIRKRDNTLPREEGRCMVCLENQILEPYYQCSHRMCCLCYSNCLLNNRRTCPVCRNAEHVLSP